MGCIVACSISTGDDTTVDVEDSSADDRNSFLPDNRVAITAHFLLHGIHHYLPMDRLRLVMPPALFIILALPFWKLVHTLFFWNWSVATAVFSGGVFGYICYDITHYALHHRTYVRHRPFSPRTRLVLVLTIHTDSLHITASSKSTTSNITMPTSRTASESPAVSGIACLVPS